MKQLTSYSYIKSFMLSTTTTKQPLTLITNTNIYQVQWYIMTVNLLYFSTDDSNFLISLHSYVIYGIARMREYHTILTRFLRDDSRREISRLVKNAQVATCE